MGAKIAFFQAKRKTDVDWYPTLSFGYLKSYLKSRTGNCFEMIRADSPEEMFDCDVLAISSSSQDYSVAQHVAKAVKKANPKIITVLGGHHVSCLPESMSDQFDIGVIGEGEQTFLELTTAFLSGADISEIPGLAFHHDGKIFLTGPRNPIVPVDNIPVPARDSWGGIYMMTSRGCPYRCSFCASSAFWGCTRFFSPARVITELEHIFENVSVGAGINIFDDLFVANRKRMGEIIAQLEKRCLIGRATFCFSVRADMVDDELCGLIKRMGNAGVSFGVESGSDRILALMNKKTTVSVNQKALDILQANGIPVNCSFIVGWPSETEEDVRATHRFIKDNISAGKLSKEVAINILMPMPGTKVWEDAVACGDIPKGDFDWNRLGVFASWRHSTAKNFQEWVEMRRENNSVYLNERFVPQERLYQIMSEYEEAVA